MVIQITTKIETSIPCPIVNIFLKILSKSITLLVLLQRENVQYHKHRQIS